MSAERRKLKSNHKTDRKEKTAELAEYGNKFIFGFLAPLEKREPVDTFKKVGQEMIREIDKDQVDNNSTTPFAFHNTVSKRPTKHQ